MATLVDPKLTKKIHELLIQHEQSERLSGDGAEAKSDKITAVVKRLRGRGVFDALDAAIATEPRLARLKPEFLALLALHPDAATRIERELALLPLRRARELVHLLGVHAAVEGYAPLANKILAEGPKHPLALQGLQLAGAIGSISSRPFIAKLIGAKVKPPEITRQLYWSAPVFALPASRRMYAEGFRKAKHPPEKIHAAWGLGKLGDEAAISYLGEMLDDTGGWRDSEYGGREHTPGEASSAARALCDIFGWPFKWGSVRQVRRLFASRTASEQRPSRSRRR